MSEVSFAVEGVEVQQFAAVPTLRFRLFVANMRSETAIQNVLLHCQIQIETAKRPYTPEEQEKLSDLFGEPDRWGNTLKSILWTHADVIIPPFHESTTVDLPVPCTFDFNVAATKYFDGLQDGEVPLNLQFSGTIFESKDGSLQAMRIPWSKEAKYRLPVSVWQQMMDHYYPNTAWLQLRRDAFELLHDYKRRQGIPTWEQTFEKLLEQAHCHES